MIVASWDVIMLGALFVGAVFYLCRSWFTKKHKKEECTKCSRS